MSINYFERILTVNITVGRSPVLTVVCPCVDTINVVVEVGYVGFLL